MHSREKRINQEMLTRRDTKEQYLVTTTEYMEAHDGEFSALTGGEGWETEVGRRGYHRKTQREACRNKTRA